MCYRDIANHPVVYGYYGQNMDGSNRLQMMTPNSMLAINEIQQALLRIQQIRYQTSTAINWNYIWTIFFDKITSNRNINFNVNDCTSASTNPSQTTLRLFQSYVVRKEMLGEVKKEIYPHNHQAIHVLITILIALVIIHVYQAKYVLKITIV